MPRQLTRSRALQQRAEKLFPGGVNSPVRAFRAVGGHPPFVVRAEGAYLWDADGNRYMDFFGSWGPMILGHAFPPVVEAVQRRRRGARALARRMRLRAIWRSWWGGVSGGGEDAVRELGDGGVHVGDPAGARIYRAEVRHQV